MAKKLMKPIPEGVSGEKYDRCVDEVKAKGEVDNPWAVCSASLQGKIKKMQSVVKDAMCKCAKSEKVCKCGYMNKIEDVKKIISGAVVGTGMAGSMLRPKKPRISTRIMSAYTAAPAAPTAPAAGGMAKEEERNPHSRGVHQQTLFDAKPGTSTVGRRLRAMSHMAEGSTKNIERKIVGKKHQNILAELKEIKPKLDKEEKTPKQKLIDWGRTWPGKPESEPESMIHAVARNPQEHLKEKMGNLKEMVAFTKEEKPKKAIDQLRSIKKQMMDDSAMAPMTMSEKKKRK